MVVAGSARGANGGRARVVARGAVAVLGLCLTAALLCERLTTPPVRALEAHASPIPPARWPTFDPASEPRPRELRVRGFFERGALRVEAQGELDRPVLALVSDDAGAPTLVEHEADFVGPGFAEFYGLATGLRHGFLRSDRSASALFETAISRGRLGVVHVELLQPSPARTLELRRGGRPLERAATLILGYEGFDLLRPWKGAPLSLEAPLDRPARITVRHADRADGGADLGLSVPIEADAGPIAIAQELGQAVLGLRPRTEIDGGPRSAGRDEFLISVSPGTDVLVAATSNSAVDLLACVPEREFEIPPRIHTWTRAPEGQPAPSIHGLEPGRYRLAVGVERRGRFTLWRPRDVGPGELVELRIGTLPSAAPDPDGFALLPAWMRSFPVAPGDGTETSRERVLHPRGLAEVWEERLGPDSSLRRRIGWRTGDGELVRAEEAELALPLPDGVAARVRELSLRVVPPGASPAWGTAWEYRATGLVGISGPFPSVPDGRLDGTALLAEGQRLTYVGAVEGGRLTGVSGPWSGPGDAARGPHASEATSHSGSEVVTAGPFARPGASEHDWSAEEVCAALGIDLDSLGISAMRLLSHPRGELRVLACNPDARVPLERGELVEVQVQEASLSLWGIFRAEPPAAHALSAGRARIAVLDRSGERTLHVSLPRAELRLGLEPGALRCLTVSAPTTAFLLSVVKSKESDKRAAEEGVGIQIEAEDALVVEHL